MVNLGITPVGSRELRGRRAARLLGPWTRPMSPRSG